MQDKTITVVSLVIERDGVVLLGRRSSTKDHAAGEWETISGRVEGNETLVEAARREALEETGLVVDVIRQLDTFSFTRGADLGETQGATFHCRVREGRERLSAEHDRFTWATLEQAKERGLPRGLLLCIETVLKAEVPEAMPTSIKGVLLVEGGVVLVKNPRNEWELPGGRIESGESPETTLAREFEEELAIQVQVGASIDSYVFEVVPTRHVRIVTYGCTLAGSFSPRISDEHSEYCVCPVNELHRLNLPAGYRQSIERWDIRRHSNAAR